jgi:hypothetical protein
MSTAMPPLLRLRYAEAAEAYLRSLPLEHFMEAVSQATQRKITVVSMDLVRVHRPDVQTFNELLIQFPLGGWQTIRQVVPDNFSVVHDAPIRADTSYDVPFQPVRPYLVMEYVSKSSKRKDYEDNHRIYERELKVPYYLVFYPDNQELTLFHLRGRRYVTVKPGRNGRLAIPELELEVAIHEGWMRFWFRGELLPLPAELQRELDDTRRRLVEESRRADQEAHRADEQAPRAEEQARRADEQARRAEELQQQVQAEREARLAAERELAELRARLTEPPRRKNGPR